jgi:hypothetical protein
MSSFHHSRGSGSATHDVDGVVGLQRDRALFADMASRTSQIGGPSVPSLTLAQPATT